MIYLLTRQTDDTTVLIAQWLIHLRKDFTRLNTIFDLPFLGGEATEESGDDYMNLQHVAPMAIDSFYFNGGNLQIPNPGIEDAALNDQVGKYVKNEIDAVLAYYALQCDRSRVFGLNPLSTLRVNKLIVLQQAKEIGFLVPETAIVSSKEALKTCKEKWGRIINKSIDIGVNIETENVVIRGQKTIEVSDEIIEHMGSHFLPSLIQQLVEKQFEIRVFYYNERIYSIALFTQNSADTKIDGRSISEGMPVREVPYELPTDLKLKVTILMKSLGLNYGSLDFILTVTDEYCFLEVNPYGQYGFLSAAGNYYIEKEIAEYL